MPEGANVLCCCCCPWRKYWKLRNETGQADMTFLKWRSWALPRACRCFFHHLTFPESYSQAQRQDARDKEDKRHTAPSMWNVRSMWKGAQRKLTAYKRNCCLFVSCFSRRGQQEDEVYEQYEASPTTPWVNLQWNENLMNHTWTEEGKGNVNRVESIRLG